MEQNGEKEPETPSTNPDQNPTVQAGFENLMPDEAPPEDIAAGYSEDSARPEQVEPEPNLSTMQPPEVDTDPRRLKAEPRQAAESLAQDMTHETLRDPDQK